ncbi:kelch repeat-containing protein [bacterium]
MNSTKYSFTKNVALKVVLIIIWLLGSVTISLAQELFLEKAPMPTAREALCTAQIDGKIYAIGGFKDESAFLSNVEVYDPVTDTWDTTKIPMPTARCAMGCAVVNGKIYVIGGWDSLILSTVEVYDPVADTWEEKTDMPAPRSFIAASSVNGKIYVIGGSKLTGTIWAGLNTVEEYDPVTDTWKSKSNMPTRRWSPSTCVVDGKIYTIGGNIGYPNISNAVEVYDPVTDTWSKKTPMPTRRYAISTSFVNGKIFAFGGWHLCSAGYPMYKIVEEYDVNSDIWTQKTDMPFHIAFFSTEVLNGKIYLIGGTDKQHTFHSIDNTFEYDPHTDLGPLVEKFNVSRIFAKAGIDSVVISTKMKDTAGITLMAEIEAPDQTPVDSFQLFDDGNHNDGDAGDSLYANVWPASSEEQLYYVDLKVTRIDTDTVIHHMNNMALLTTIGPVVFENVTFGGSDTEPNPGDNISIYVTLKNHGQTGTATGIKAQLVSLETSWINVLTDTKSYHDIPPGEPGQNLTSYRLKILDAYPGNTPIPMEIHISSHGTVFWSEPFSIPVGSTDVQARGESGPARFALYDNYPNPFNPETTIEYSVQHSSRVNLKIYNTMGQTVRTLEDDYKTTGEYAVIWDGKDHSGKALPSGNYIYEIQMDGFASIKKMILKK